jgi:hypothetical protein
VVVRIEKRRGDPSFTWRSSATAASRYGLIEAAAGGLLLPDDRDREHELLPDGPSLSAPLPSLRVSLYLGQECLGPQDLGRTLGRPRHEHYEASQEGNRICQNAGVRFLWSKVDCRGDLVVGTIARFGDVGRSYDDSQVTAPRKQAELRMLFAGPNPYRQHIPTERVLYARLGVVDQHARVDTAEPALALE